ncbi:MAG: Gfo/Idh/MocA family oxidoreductase [Clostridiales bacterium]|nr:Gfo/Idh/MocA family oxidoreductase [Clostridiales bacterium]
MRVCIIGDCGGHIGSIFDGRLGPHTYVGAAASSDLESLEGLGRLALSKTGRELPLFADWREMLDTLRPDIAAVDCLFSHHAEVACFALERGIHVFSEKPAATTVEDLRMLEETAARSGARLFSMLTARFDPWFYTARKLVEAGELGDLLLAGGQKSYKLGRRPAFFHRRETYGGTIPWVGIHTVDQLLWLTGRKCTEVYAKQTTLGNGGHGELETAAALLLELEGGLPAHVNIDYGRPQNAPSHGDDRVRLVGTKGVLEVRGDRVFLINDRQDGREPVENMTPEPIFDGFIRLLQGSDDPMYAGCDGLTATRVCLAARESAGLGRPIAL